MKAFLVFGGLLAASTGIAQAQSIAAGTISLGGSIGYSRSSSEVKNSFGPNTVIEKNTTSLFQISPSVGHFFADNLAVGLNLNYTVASGEPDNQSIFQVGPYVQYYKMISEQFGVLGTLGAGYQSIRKGPNGFYAAITPGVIFFPIPKFGVSASIGSLEYARLSQEDDRFSVKTSSFGANFGLNQLRFGGTYYFGR